MFEPTLEIECKQATKAEARASRNVFFLQVKEEMVPFKLMHLWRDENGNEEWRNVKVTVI